MLMFPVALPVNMQTTNATPSEPFLGIRLDLDVSAYVGDGTNRWPAVHRLDAAKLYRVALESAPAGTRLHAIGDEGVALRDIVALIGRLLNVPVVSKSPKEADDHFSWLMHFVMMDNPASSALTQERFEWRPGQATLLSDIDR